MDIPILDKVIDIIKTKKEVVFNSHKEILPSIYYIGMGKTGSKSLWVGFPNNSVAHWHSLKGFEKIHDCKLLSDNNYDLYDLVLYIGRKYKFKPLIIECLREPISLYISKKFQHMKYDRGDCKCVLCEIKIFNNVTEANKIRLFTYVKNNIRPFNLNRIRSIEMYRKHFNIELTRVFDINDKYYYNELEGCKILFLRYEDIDDREMVFQKLGYKFASTKQNTTSENNNNTLEYYRYTLDNIRFSKDELDKIYNSSFDVFYDRRFKERCISRYSNHP